MTSDHSCKHCENRYLQAVCSCVTVEKNYIVEQNGSNVVSKSLNALIERAQKVRMTEPEKHEQRISFVYGTTHIENENVTRDIVVAVAAEERK